MHNIGHASWLAKHAVQTIAGPLERTAVARDAERHLSLDHLDGTLVQCEKSEKLECVMGLKTICRPATAGYE
jgi:hypothetical protein